MMRSECCRFFTIRHLHAWRWRFGSHSGGLLDERSLLPRSQLVLRFANLRFAFLAFIQGSNSPCPRAIEPNASRHAFKRLCLLCRGCFLQNLASDPTPLQGREWEVKFPMFHDPGKEWMC